MVMQFFFNMLDSLFPTCHVRVVRFYVSWTPPPSSAPSPSPPDLKLQALDRSIPAGPEQQAPDQSGPCQTSTAMLQRKQFCESCNGTCRWGFVLEHGTSPLPTTSLSSPSCPLPPLKRMPERMPDIEYQNRCQIECQNRCQIECQNRY